MGLVLMVWSIPATNQKSTHNSYTFFLILKIFVQKNCKKINAYK